MKIAELLKSYREVNRLSLRQCSKVIGLPYTTLHRIECGKPVDQAALVLLINWMFGVKSTKVSPNTSTNIQSDAITLWKELLVAYEDYEESCWLRKNINRINAVVA